MAARMCGDREERPSTCDSLMATGGRYQCVGRYQGVGRFRVCLRISMVGGRLAYTCVLAAGMDSQTDNLPNLGVCYRDRRSLSNVHYRG